MAAAKKTSRPSAHRHNWLSSRSSRFDAGSDRLEVELSSGMGGLRWREKDYFHCSRQIAPSVALKAVVHDRTFHHDPSR
jgi:hypothetical protein